MIPFLPPQIPAVQVPTKPVLRSPDAARLGELVQARPLTIEDAVTISLLTSRDFARSLASLEQARGRTSEARAGLNPTVGVNGTINAYSAPIDASFGGGASIPIQRQFVGIYNAGVTLPIDISGSIRAAVGQAQFNEIALRIDVNRVRNTLVFDVRSAFYAALRAQGTLVVAQETLSNTQARLADARATLAAGTGTQFDVLTAQRDVADAQGSLVNARGAVTVALAQLKNAMGIDVSTPISIVDTGAVEDPGGDAPTVEPSNEDLHSVKEQVALGPEYQTAVAEAIRNRPEVLEGNAAVSAARRGVSFARRSQLPSLAVSANYNVQPNFAGFTPANQGTIGLTFSVPIFDGGVARARVRQAESVVAQAEIDRRTSIDAVTLEVQQAYVNEAQARERVRVANVAVGQAREAFRLARLRSQAGVSAGPQQSPQIELSNAQVALTQAETNRVNALYDYNVARSALQRATGRYSYGSGGGFSQPPTEKETGTATSTQP